MKTKILFTTVTILFCYTIAYAQPGSLDFSFDPGTGTNNTVYTTTIQSDGKIIIGGQFTTYNGIARNYIARLNMDGTIDTSFNPVTGANSTIYASAIQSDGKIIIGGQFTTYNGTGRNYIARLNTDGTLDTSFDPGTGAGYSVYTITIQSDGQIIIGGQFTSFDGTVRNRIARLNTDGTLDITFNPILGASDVVYTTAIQSNGQIIIGGWFTSYDGTARNYVARLNMDGTLDTSFDPGMGAGYRLRKVAIQSDGQIIIGGQFTSYDGTGRNFIARLNTDGSLDTSFDPGMGASDEVYTIAIQGDGKIIIGGWFISYNGTARNYIARLNTDGTLDTSFNPGTGASYRLNALAIQNDGKIIIGGQFISYNGTARARIARLTYCSPSASILNETACDSYTSPSNSYMWTTSGTYSDTILNTTGCDSVITINLTINNSSSSSQIATACNSFMWNNATYTISGNYTDTIPNTMGCDSIMTLNLTINYSTTFSQTLTINNGDSIQIGNNVYTTSGTYIDTLIASNGCDSTVTTNVDILTETNVLIEQNMKITIYPNPFTSKAILRTDQILRNTSLTVYNSFGQEIRKITNISEQIITLDRDNLPIGLYFLKLTQGNKGLATDKIVITD